MKLQKIYQGMKKWVPLQVTSSRSSSGTDESEEGKLLSGSHITKRYTEATECFDDKSKRMINEFHRKRQKTLGYNGRRPSSLAVTRNSWFWRYESMCKWREEIHGTDGRVAVFSASDSQAGDPGFDSLSGHLLDLFSVVVSLNPRSRL